jgi:uncharacterized membrane protein
MRVTEMMKLKNPIHKDLFIAIGLSTLIAFIIAFAVMYKEYLF